MSEWVIRPDFTDVPGTAQIVPGAAQIVTGRGGRIGRELVSRTGDRGFKPRSGQTNDLSN